MPAKRPNNPARELLFGDLWEYDPAPETADDTANTTFEIYNNDDTTMV